MLIQVEKEVTLKLEAPYRKDIPKFFLEMVTHWLVPGKTLFIARFLVTRVGDQISCEAVVEPGEEKELLTENLPHWEEEIKLGVRSSYHAKKLLELKGLFLEEKEGFVQEAIRGRVLKDSGHFDYDIFPLMQKFLVSVSEEYKNSHSYELLARVICNGYLVLQKVLEGMEESPEKRHFFLKILPGTSSTLFGEKRVIGCFVGMNFLKDNEILEDKQLIRAVRKYCLEAMMVAGSYFIQRDEKTVMFYLELEQDESFTFEEIALLKRELKEQVKVSIENLVRPVFMPRNEEEVMKYIVTLSKQVTMAKDLPQIVIMFNEQTDVDLVFTLVLVRPLFSDEAPIQKVFLSAPFEIQIEKIRQAGHIRKNVSKEASQIRICMKKGGFLREDFVVDLYKARQAIVSWLEGSLGAVRDYNGGMISRQMEIFSTFQESVGGENEHNLSNFFHALYPIELRTAVPIHTLQQFYEVFNKFLVGSQDVIIKEEKKVLYICMKEKNNFLELLAELKISPFRLLQLHLTVQEKPILGFAFFSESEEEKNIFIQFVRQVI